MPAKGDYRLASSSPFLKRGNDGLDPGANTELVKPMVARHYNF